ncbi:MAG: HAMP domain-containing histidine kinase [Anaerolineae bacterium]|nr:HAMP domain-containing histidine kinase [Anaerolineae bacterium]
MHSSGTGTRFQVVIDSQLDPDYEFIADLQEQECEILYAADALRATSCQPDVYIIDLRQTSEPHQLARLSEAQTRWPTAIVVAVSDTTLPDASTIASTEQIVLAYLCHSVNSSLLANLVRGVVSRKCHTGSTGHAATCKGENQSPKQQAHHIWEALMLTGQECRLQLNQLVSVSDEVLHIKDDTLSAEVRTAMKSVRQSAVSMRCAVNNYLNLTRLENGKLTIHPTLLDPVRDVLEPVLVGYAELLEARGQTAQIRVNRPGLLVWADKALLINVYDNLIHNVLEFGEQDGTIAFNIMERGNVDEFSVWSRGQPPDSKCLERLVYVTSDITGRNAEIGMYLASKIIEVHGGRLGIETRAGAWMNFIFTLPKREVASRDRKIRTNDFCFNACL